MKLRKNDMVSVRVGRDRGKQGRVLRIFKKENLVLVEGINRIHKHMRRTRENPKGGIVLMEIPISVSKLLYLCPRCNRPTRMGSSILADGTKKRICKKCKEILD